MIIPAAEVQFYDVVVFFHILAVMLAFGPALSYGIFFGVMGSSTPMALPGYARALVTYSRKVQTPAMIVILAAGIYLAADIWDGGEFFIIWGYAALLILFGMVHGFFMPNTTKFADAAEAGRQDEAMAYAEKLRKGGMVSGLIIVLTVYVMTAKPFL